MKVMIHQVHLKCLLLFCIAVGSAMCNFQNASFYGKLLVMIESNDEKFFSPL